MDDQEKHAPCAICGKQLPLPPWPIVEGSLICLEHDPIIGEDDKPLGDTGLFYRKVRD